MKHCILFYMPACPYCGNHPTSHAAARMNERLEEWCVPFEYVVYSRPVHFAERFWMRILPVMVRFGVMLGVVKYNDDIKKSPIDRARVLWEEADRQDIPMRQLIVFGNLTDAYEARINDRTIVFDGLPIPPRFPLHTLPWLDDKEKLRLRLAANGIPVPHGGVCTRFAQMQKLFATLQKPVIVKPARGSRGRHTTTFIYTEEQLRHAYEVGKQISRRLIIEEHLTGSVYRATIVNEKLVGVLRGDPPRVRGDGTHTIRQLIEEKNRHRDPRVSDFQITGLTEEFLGRSNWTLDAVLPAGVTIDLTEKIGITYGGHSAEELPICHPDTCKILEDAGRVVGFPVMGFDFIIEDITKSPHEQRWGIIECNSLPFINLHHDPIEGTPINVAAEVWKLWTTTNRS